MNFDPGAVRLGRPFARVDSRTLKLSRYLDLSKLPAAPARVNYGDKIAEWQMFLNDELGDCTCAGLLHMMMVWATQNGLVTSFTDADVKALYRELCGWDGTADTDNGGILLDILKAWRKAPIMGRTLEAYVSVNPKDWRQIQLAHWLFGPLYMGVNLPLSAQKEKIWSSTKDTPGGWGGHCVVSVGYRNGSTCIKPPLLTLSTWGTTIDATAGWIAEYCDEIWAVLSPDWPGADGLAPNGFNLAQLRADQAHFAA
jgi:hypothetical protein